MEVWNQKGSQKSSLTFIETAAGLEENWDERQLHHLSTWRNQSLKWTNECIKMDEKPEQLKQQIKQKSEKCIDCYIEGFFFLKINTVYKMW